MHRVADVVGHLLRPAQDIEGAVPAGALADRLLEPLHGLEVVVEDVGPGLHDGLQPLVGAVEVGDEHLDAHPGARRRIGGSSRRRCAAPPSGRSSRATLVTTTCSRRIAATASATRRGSSSSNQVGRPVLTAQKPQARVQVSPRIMIVAVPLVPALPDVRAAGLLADRVELQAAQQPLEVVVVVAGRHPRPDPVGVAATGSEPSAAGSTLRRPWRSSRAGCRAVGGSIAAGGAEHRELAGHGRSVPVRWGRPRPSRTEDVARRPASRSRGAKPSSRVALPWTPSTSRRRRRARPRPGRRLPERPPSGRRSGP